MLDDRDFAPKPNYGGALLVKNGQHYTLTSPELQSRTVLLNGQALALNDQDQLPALSGETLTSGEATFAPVSITFVALPDANNAACAKP